MILPNECLLRPTLGALPRTCFCFFRIDAISDEGPGLLAPDPGDFLHGQKVTKKPPRGLCPLWTPPLLLGRRGPEVRSTTRWCPSSELLRAPLARLAECYSPPAGPPCRTPCRTAQRMRHAYRTRRAVSPAPCRWPGSLSKESCFSEANPTMGTVGPGSCGGDSATIGPEHTLGKRVKQVVA